MRNHSYHVYHFTTEGAEWASRVRLSPQTCWMSGVDGHTVARPSGAPSFRVGKECPSQTRPHCPWSCGPGLCQMKQDTRKVSKRIWNVLYHISRETVPGNERRRTWQATRTCLLAFWAVPGVTSQGPAPSRQTGEPPCPGGLTRWLQGGAWLWDTDVPRKDVSCSMSCSQCVSNTVFKNSWCKTISDLGLVVK